MSEAWVRCLATYFRNNILHLYALPSLALAQLPSAAMRRSGCAGPAAPGRGGCIRTWPRSCSCAGERTKMSKTARPVAGCHGRPGTAGSLRPGRGRVWRRAPLPHRHRRCQLSLLAPGDSCRPLSAITLCGFSQLVERRQRCHRPGHSWRNAASSPAQRHDTTVRPELPGVLRSVRCSATLIGLLLVRGISRRQCRRASRVLTTCAAAWHRMRSWF